MCTHSVRQGDNYGETCLICGATTAGYGYWSDRRAGEGSRECLHDWHSMGDDSDYEFCSYCQREQLKPNRSDSANEAF